MRTLSDRDLIDRFVGEQDEEAFARLVERHQGMVYRVALRRCNGNHALAEDLVQSVMILLARKASAAGRARSVAGWLQTATCLCARNMLRKEVRKAQLHRKHAEEQENVTTEQKAFPHLDDRENAEWSAACAHLDEAVAALPTRMRDVLVMHYYEGVSFEELSSQLGRPSATLRAWAARARKKLRAKLAGRGIVLSSAVLVGGLEAEAAVAVAELGTQTAGAASAGGVGAILAGARGKAASTAAATAREVMRHMAWQYGLKLAGVGLLAAGVLTGGITFAIRPRPDGDGGMKVTVRGAAASEPFAELCRRELPVAAMGPGHSLVVPAELRFKSVDVRRLVETVAASGELKVKWIPEGRGAILYAGASDSDVDSFLAQIGSADVDERVAAARRGGWLEDPRVIPGLVKAAQDGDARVRRQARWSLGERLGWASAAIMMPDETTRLLREELNTPTRGGGRAAAGIPYLPADEAFGLIQMLGESDSRAFSCMIRCKNILAALRKIGGGEADALVLDVAENRTSDPRVQAEMFASLAERKGAAAVPIIDKILESGSKNASAATIAARRVSAFEALTIAGDPRVGAWAEEWLQSSDPGTRHRATRALRAWHGPKEFDLLTKALELEDTAVRSAAVSALGEIGDSRAARLIEERLQDDDASVRYVAARSLCLLERKKGLKLLARVLGGDDERMRVAAVGAVGRIGGADALVLLEKTLRDDASAIRSAAARALGGLNGSAKVVSLLEQALQDEDAKVRSAAVYGLSRLGGLRAMEALERAYGANPGDRHVKVALSRALGMSRAR